MLLPAMRSIIRALLCLHKPLKAFWFVYFYDQRIAGRSITGMFDATISTRTGREAQCNIRLRLQLNEVSRTYRAGLHEILMRVLGESCQHEDIHYIMHMHLSLSQTQAKVIRHSPREV